jgi:transcriptional regulator with XRE-family HTH domain
MLNDPNYEWLTMEEVLTEFAAPKIAAAREKHGLTQKQLGAKLGMPQSQISRLEKHPESVTYRTLQRVAKALGVKVTDLIA